MKRSFAVMSLGLILLGGVCRAYGFEENPQKSFFFGFDLGAGLDLDKEARSPVDLQGLRPEAYSLGAFLFGITGGFRFNEVIGFDVGWHEQRHDAHDEWGGVAYYQMAHAAFRLAWPLPTRQTLVLRIAPTIGTFTYGDVLPGFFEDNSTLVAGGLIGVTLEHEFSLGVVGLLQVSYFPLFRRGMGGVLRLCDDYDWDGCSDAELPVADPTTEPETDVLIDTKDFSKSDFVHILWISAGFQFEWTFR